MHKPHKKIAYILSQFPETHETFILREVIELKKNNIILEIFSLKKCKDKVIHPLAQQFLSNTHYSSLISIPIIKSLIFFLWKKPFTCFNLLAYLVKKNISSFEFLKKSLGILPISLYYAKQISSKGISHIHAHWATIPTTSAIIISTILNIPFSFTAHAWDIFLPNPMLKEKVRRAEFVATCTGYNKRYLDSLLDQRVNDNIFLNYHGIDFETLPKVNKNIEENLIFSIGRLCEQKGFPFLLEACALLRDRGIDIKCLIVGEGPNRKSLSNTIEQLNLTDRVSLMGMQPQSYIFEMFNKARMFVLPCVISKNGDRDGIPNVMIEALAMRTPVISTTVSGVPEIIIDHVTGLTVEPRNSAQLADAIIEMLRNPEQSFMYTENGRKLVEEKFDIKKNIRELVSIFINQAQL
ncbi:MAG: glycosyltransferase family 4 protein [Candidatus Cloacimonetes bacterium]|nr:glycosyltransferase family 4 protein [Candidatus Cloacimonadota bacterium]